MRSLSIPLLCFLLVFALWFLCADYTSDTTELLIPTLEETYDLAAAGEWDSAEGSYLRFRQQWNKFSGIYTFYMNSCDLDFINLSIVRCEGYLRAADTALACGELLQITERLAQIHEDDLICMNNIL